MKYMNLTTYHALNCGRDSIGQQAILQERILHGDGWEGL